MYDTVIVLKLKRTGYPLCRFKGYGKSAHRLALACHTPTLVTSVGLIKGNKGSTVLPLAEMFDLPPLRQAKIKSLSWHQAAISRAVLRLWLFGRAICGVEILH